MCHSWKTNGYHPRNSTHWNLNVLKNEPTFWKGATGAKTKLQWPPQGTKTKNKTENSPNKLLLTESRGLQQPTQEEEGQERLMEVDTGVLDGIHPEINQFPMALKAAYGKDPDLPTYAEAMAGTNREQYEEAMVKEIPELEQHKTWVMMPQSKVPANAKVLPSTWVFPSQTVS